MKTKATRNYLKNVYKNVYCAGYCDLQYISRCTEAAYYNSGVYGWNWDAYADFKTDAVITTGYRSMIGSRVPGGVALYHMCPLYFHIYSRFVKFRVFQNFEKSLHNRLIRAGALRKKSYDRLRANISHLPPIVCIYSLAVKFWLFRVS